MSIVHEEVGAVAGAPSGAHTPFRRFLSDFAESRIAVAGFIVAVGDEIRLCEVLAESFPPQCGGANITVTDLDQVDPEDLQSESNVRWTDDYVTIFGEMVDGTLVSTPIQ